MVYGLIIKAGLAAVAGAKKKRNGGRKKKKAVVRDAPGSVTSSGSARIFK